MGTTQTTSLSVMRDEFQQSDQALTDTDYEIVILATNSEGSGDPVSGTFTVQSGTKNYNTTLSIMYTHSTFQLFLEL